MAKVRPLPDFLQKVAIEELNEDPNRVTADIASLKTWIEQQPHLTARTDEQFLLAFLRGSKYSLEKAKTKIDKFYMMRTKYPEMFTIHGMPEEKVVEIIKLGVFLICPTPVNETGPRIIVVRNGCYDANKYDFLEGIEPVTNARLFEIEILHAANLDNLYSKVPLKYWPQEYGGENGTIPEIVERTIQKYFEYKNYFADDANYGTDEKLRPGKPIDFDNLFGMEGSFRKLNVD